MYVNVIILYRSVFVGTNSNLYKFHLKRCISKIKHPG